MKEIHATAISRCCQEHKKEVNARLDDDRDSEEVQSAQHKYQKSNRILILCSQDSPGSLSTNEEEAGQ